MRRVQTIQLFILGTTLIGALGCADPTDGKPEAVVGDVQHEAASSDEGQKWVFDAESTIGFVGSKVTGSHDGGFTVFTGAIMLVDNDPTRSSVHVDIDTTSLWANNEKLTGHLKSADFFDVESNPTASFDSTAIVAEGDGYSITGNLDLHGVSKSIAFPAMIAIGDVSTTVSAEFSIKRFDFDIAYKGAADDLIRDDVLIKLSLVASPE